MRKNFQAWFKKKYSIFFNLLIALLIFTIPSNLFYKFATNQSYVSGLYIDYLTFKIYLSDIIIFIILSLFLVRYGLQSIYKLMNVLKIKQNYFFLLLIVLLGCYQLLTPKPLAALSYILKTIYLILGFIIINKQKTLINKKILFCSLITTTLFQTLLAIYQYIAQKSFLGYLFFGEPTLNHLYGISNHTTLTGNLHISAYGTTAHPNILAGIIVVFCILSFLLFQNCSNHKKNYFHYLFFIPAVVILFLTYSFSAFLTLFIALMFTKLKKPIKINTPIYLLSLLIIPVLISTSNQFLPNNISLNRRHDFNLLAFQAIKQNPICGTGLNNITTNLNLYDQYHSLQFFIQPIHNILLLFLAETGVMGIIIFFMATKKLKFNKLNDATSKFLLILLPIASLDHYLLTQQSGLLLFLIGLIIFNSYYPKKNHSTGTIVGSGVEEG